jgi:hypothetical protein
VAAVAAVGGAKGFRLYVKAGSGLRQPSPVHPLTRPPPTPPTHSTPRPTPPHPPTHPGCFDREEDAARAYDRMMLWIEMHSAGAAKAGVTNFDVSQYAGDLPWLASVTQVGAVGG